MAQAVSRRPLNAEAQFRSQTSSCQVFGGQSGTGTGFSPSSSVFPVSIILPIILTHVHQHVARTRRTNGPSLAIFQEDNLFRNLGALVRKISSVYVYIYMYVYKYIKVHLRNELFVFFSIHLFNHFISPELVEPF